MKDRSRFSWFKFVSLLSGASLVVFGALSLAISLFFWSVSGILVSLALLGHGSYELAQRRVLLRAGRPAAVNRLFWNQVALAASVSLYLVWHFAFLDTQLVVAAMEAPATRPLWALYPEGFKDELTGFVPLLLRLSYGAMALALWLGCGLTARLYRREGKAFISCDRGPE